ncbi:hypothetical protein [Candidatus Spongiihabitans sp.]|uniref:hypothetical protein n=1 Tax=Candidatus Spongiihabitans sp. TaxID=3101308 RepID=UPI003C6F0315
MEKVTIISCFISENWRTGKHGHQQQKPLAYEGGFILLFILNRLFLAVNWNVFNLLGSCGGYVLYGPASFLQLIFSKTLQYFGADFRKPCMIVETSRINPRISVYGFTVSATNFLRTTLGN